MLERNASALDIAVALTEMTELHPREVVRTFSRAVLDATGGYLEDDATVLCLDWSGPQGSGGDGSPAPEPPRAGRRGPQAPTVRRTPS